MKLFIDHSSAIPLHSQVEQLLRELIKQEQYIEGKPLPKEVDLSKILGIARNTVRQGINKLVYEGTLTRKKGVGTFVSKNNVSTRLDNWSSFTEEMNRKGIPFENLDIEATFIKSDEVLAATLNIKKNKEVLVLKRLRGDKDGPFVYFISYFHPRIGLTGNEDFNMPLYEMLESKFATRPSISKEEIQAISANGDIADKLIISEGDPVLFRKRLVCDPGDRIIEYNLCYYRSDKFTYTIDIKRH